MKKYELYELQPEADNFIKDVETIEAATSAATEYFTVKFKDLIVKNTIKHQVSALLKSKGYRILKPIITTEYKEI